MYKALENIKVRVDGKVRYIKKDAVVLLSTKDAKYLIDKGKIHTLTNEIGYDLYIYRIMCQIIKRETIGNDKCLPFLNEFLAAIMEEDLSTLKNKGNSHD